MSSHCFTESGAFSVSLSELVRDQGPVTFRADALNQGLISVLVCCKGGGTAQGMGETARIAYARALDVVRQSPTKEDLLRVRASFRLPPGYVIVREKTPADL